MYEDIEGPVELPTKSYGLFPSLHAIMDIYRCYNSRPMCARLEALIFGNRSGGDDIRYACPYDLMLVGRALHSPDIWTDALKSAALKYYQTNGRPVCDTEEIEEWCCELALFSGCDVDIISTIQIFSYAIWKHHDPIKRELQKLNMGVIRSK